MNIFKCEVCGNTVSFIENKGPKMVCCDKEMTELEVKTQEQEGKEKHVPVIEGNKIKVGSIQHPMEEEHYIQLIQLWVDDKLVVEKRLYPGDVPEMDIMQEYEGKNIKVRELCNKHGYWSN